MHLKTKIDSVESGKHGDEVAEREKLSFRTITMCVHIVSITMEEIIFVVGVP